MLPFYTLNEAAVRRARQREETLSPLGRTIFLSMRDPSPDSSEELLRLHHAPLVAGALVRWRRLRTRMRERGQGRSGGW